MSGIERIMVPGLLAPVSHYCHVVRSGDHVWISGMVGAREDRNDLPESVSEQFRIALESVDAALRAAGGTGPENIVKVTVYLTDVNDRAKINPIREEYFGEHRPASVQSTDRPEALQEVFPHPSRVEPTGKIIGKHSS